MTHLFRRYRRRRLRKRPLPEGWLAIVERRLPFTAAYTDNERERFLSDLKVFVWERHFFGAADLEITDEIRVTVAGSAVRLTLALDVGLYDRLREIVVYPYDYKHPDRDGVVLGEAHAFGTVVLSWPAVLRGLADPDDGHDTAVHEFAHVLDKTSLGFDGTPRLRAREDYHPWGEVMSEHFLRLRDRDPRVRSVMRDYGALNEAEFFAVATESFFERPEDLRRRAPELYAVLARFYGPSR